MKILRHFWLLAGSLLTLLVLSGVLGGASALAAPVQGASGLDAATPRSIRVTPKVFHVTPKVYHVTPVVHQVTPQTRGTFTMYTVPGNDPSPIGITEGPDKNLWFAAYNALAIGMMTPSGKFTEYGLPLGASPFDITTGPDGNLWFTGGGAVVGKITLNGTVTVFNIPGAGDPSGITAGSDGNLWFTLETTNKIASITPAGVITEYPVPTPSSGPWWIISRPNGTLWFTEYSAVKLAEFTISTHSFTEYPIPNVSRPLQGITSGLNGTIWFADAGHIGFIDIKTGKITVYGTPSGHGANYIALGPDKGYWFTATGLVDRSSAKGKIVEYTAPVYGDLQAIIAGPKNRMWFTEGGNVIGSVTTS